MECVLLAVVADDGRLTFVEQRVFTAARCAGPGVQFHFFAGGWIVFGLIQSQKLSWF